MAANKIPMEIRIKTHIIIDPITQCWNWTGTKNPFGYGKMTLRINTVRKYSTSHKESYKYFVGEIPTGLYVLHRCDNPSCCNPKHLYVGTNSDNQKDRYHRTKRFNRDVTNGRFINGG